MTEVTHRLVPAIHSPWLPHFSPCVSLHRASYSRPPLPVGSYDPVLPACPISLPIRMNELCSKIPSNHKMLQQPTKPLHVHFCLRSNFKIMQQSTKAVHVYLFIVGLCLNQVDWTLVCTTMCSLIKVGYRLSTDWKMPTHRVTITLRHTMEQERNHWL